MLYGLIFFLLSLAAIFSYNSGMTDTHILPKWIYTLGVLAIAMGMYGIFLCMRKREVRTNERTLFAVMGLLCLTQALYAISQSVGLLASRFPYRVVGSFDNPAGLAACLCVGIPCCIYLYRNSGNVIKWSSVAVALLIGAALVLSESRAGIVAGVLVPCAWLLFSRVKKCWGRILLLILGIAVLVGMYFLKKNSADGRLLMLYGGWEMVKERPLLGHGTNAIAAHYMDYQAAWLTQHSESRLAPLADNVKHVFNEYLSIAICYGSLGLGLLFLFVGFLVHCYRKTPSEEGKCALLLLGSIGMLACFSYPLTYPFTWIVLASASWILIRRAYPINVTNNRLVRYALAVTLVITSVCMLHQMRARLKAELQWGKLADVVLIENDPQVFTHYEDLMGTLGDEPYFLYNYAAELYMAGRYEQALQVAQRCRAYWADYDLELLLGELQMKTGEYAEAEKHYYKAAAMCPVRFIPLYKLYKLYQQTDAVKKARDIRQVILEKPIKVDSSTIRRIIGELRRDMNTTY